MIDVQASVPSEHLLAAVRAIVQNHQEQIDSSEYAPMAGVHAVGFGAARDLANLIDGAVTTPAQPEEVLREARDALTLVRSIIMDAAPSGMNPAEGDWAERLYASQATTHKAVKAINAALRSANARQPSKGPSKFAVWMTTEDGTDLLWFDRMSALRILTAAIKVDDLVITVPRPKRHNDIHKILWDLKIPIFHEVQGFLDSDGNFRERKQSLYILHAMPGKCFLDETTKGNRSYTARIYSDDPFPHCY